MHQPLDPSALAQLFTQARTFSTWQDRAVPVELLHQLYELTKYAPTSANSSPARFVFIHSPEAKAKLKPALAEGNIDKTMTAPVTVIVAADYTFYEQLPQLFPHTDARAWFVGNEALIHTTAFRNSSLQGAYLIMAARALGLDTGAMSGFNNTLLDETFFAGTAIKSNFLINLGYGDARKLHERHPRLAFEYAAQII
ncbi:malonic semialdehyde reductase [Agitococcus lubricus]|uniref:Putative NADH dehydrogenase/NAD(P)H nitroreductase C8N29_11728 n=1 Tax=Agitococcus lubricus TaxID=1077255 RepID=A0A2T5IUX9_9GAMM|nr:malonic semialdehyde reductase [Agitococcus lubricus]PTQ87704.1 3-hydroxypropanoate dehydrogenase [Agitococcus lubricus]